MKYLFILLSGIIFVNSGLSGKNLSDTVSLAFYNKLGESKPSIQTFLEAYNGYQDIKKVYRLNPEKPYLTVIDFTISSDKKRLWVIDMDRGEVIYHTYVAHGKNSGSLYATSFSNKKGSYQSSLGFYITGKTYTGRNGYSMYLDGIEENINHRARERAIVMHGAWYATEKFIIKHGRLGRSFGCPAVPVKIHKELINRICNRTVLFIYHTDYKKVRVLQSV